MAKRIYAQPDTTAVPQVPVDDSTNPRAFGFSMGKRVGEGYDKLIWEPLAKARNPEGYAMLKRYEAEGTPVYAEDYQIVARKRGEAEGFLGTAGGIGASVGAVAGGRALGGLAARAGGAALGGLGGSFLGPVGTIGGAALGFLAPVALERFASQAAGIQRAGGDPLVEDILLPGISGAVGKKLLKSGIAKRIGKGLGESVIGKEAMEKLGKSAGKAGTKASMAGVPVGESVLESKTAAQLRKEFLAKEGRQTPTIDLNRAFNPSTPIPEINGMPAYFRTMPELGRPNPNAGSEFLPVAQNLRAQGFKMTPGDSGVDPAELLRQEFAKRRFDQRVDRGAVLKGAREIRRGRATTAAINGPGVLPQDPTDVIGSPRWQEALQEEIRAKFGVNVSPQQIRQAAASELSKSGIPPTADVTAQQMDDLNRIMESVRNPKAPIPKRK